MVWGGQILFDAYDRKARLAPSMLAVTPLLTAAIFGIENAATLERLATLLVAVGGLWLLTDMSRGLGRAHQSKLFARWGGTPSIQLLRHSNPTIDPNTKARYHACLRAKAKVTLPTPEEESSNLRDADACYDSALQWLLQHTRDKKRFSLLAAENATYGFRRNGYGIRWLGLGVCALTAAWSIGLAYLHSSPSFVVAITQPGTVVQLALAVALSLVWLFYFREAMVRDAAFAYARELIRTCEVIAVSTSGRKPRSPATSSKSGAATLGQQRDSSAP
ncbi:Uncharacterised protein [Burkholderia pseudomallei]|uniref:hypothetical protein n=1 Tax=Burkholderia pseudomallei TaxID=28450 RepID=UPI000F1ECEF7|nr:hypothetical protein [Burkholderia pseudomallei]CAJ7234347.1 Uncharacterised protein [Burkholderia pseudomallei]VBC15623.1 Uncharacterised protein [Burkholderia pseudomallei]VBS98935.1 Uncharacterised protein [Burkholderia pseudomallei]